MSEATNSSCCCIGISLGIKGGGCISSCKKERCHGHRAWEWGWPIKKVVCKIFKYLCKFIICLGLPYVITKINKLYEAGWLSMVKILGYLDVYWWLKEISTACLIREVHVIDPLCVCIIVQFLSRCILTWTLLPWQIASLKSLPLHILKHLKVYWTFFHHGLVLESCLWYVWSSCLKCHSQCMLSFYS